MKNSDLISIKCDFSVPKKREYDCIREEISTNSVLTIFQKLNKMSTYKRVVFHAKRDRTTNADAHLAHLQAQPHKLMLQLAKEPNFCQRTNRQ